MLLLSSAVITQHQTTSLLTLSYITRWGHWNTGCEFTQSSHVPSTKWTAPPPHTRECQEGCKPSLQCLDHTTHRRETDAAEWSWKALDRYRHSNPWGSEGVRRARHWCFRELVGLLVGWVVGWLMSWPLVRDLLIKKLIVSHWFTLRGWRDTWFMIDKNTCSFWTGHVAGHFTWFPYIGGFLRSLTSGCAKIPSYPPHTWASWQKDRKSMVTDGSAVLIYEGTKFDLVHYLCLSCYRYIRLAVVADSFWISWFWAPPAAWFVNV